MKVFSKAIDLPLLKKNLLLRRHFLQVTTHIIAISKDKQLQPPCPSSLINSHSFSSMYEYLSIQNLISSYTWWPRNGSWSFPSFSSRCMGACRTLNSSRNSSRSSEKVSSKQPWQREHGYSPEESTQVMGVGQRGTAWDHKIVVTKITFF